MEHNFVTLEEFIGSTAASAGFDTFYDDAVKKFGGTEVIKKYIPFSEETLRQSYAKDTNFCTDLTPLNMWDIATGIPKTDKPAGRFTSKPIATGFALYAATCGCTAMALSQAVCILKQAARQLIMDQTNE